MTLDGVPIRAEDVDRAAAQIALVEPQDSMLQLRRLALTNVIFPRMIAAELVPEERERSRASAEAWQAALTAGAPPVGPWVTPNEIELEGRWFALDPAIWEVALELPLKTWSPVVESVGVHSVFQVIERRQANMPGLVEFVIRGYEFPYLDPTTGRADLEAALDRAHLSIVDEAWRDAVPTYWQHRMRGGSS
jgi:hypothetical protein